MEEITQEKMQILEELKEQDMPMICSALIMTKLQTKSQCQSLMNYLEKTRDLTVDTMKALSEIKTIIENSQQPIATYFLTKKNKNKK